MNTRRSFFQRIAGLVAAVAIAPEIAFRTKLALPTAELTHVGWQMDVPNNACHRVYVRSPMDLDHILGPARPLSDWAQMLKEGICRG